MYQIKLKTPEAIYTSEQSLSISASKVKAWLATIKPLAAEKVHTQFLRTLKKINRIQLDTLVRYEIMEVLESASKDIIINLVNKLSQTSSTSNERYIELSDYLQVLLNEMANGYKIILKEILASEALISEHLGHILPKTSLNIIGFFSDLLIERYQRYLSEPAGIWYELNHIYLLNEHLGLSELNLGTINGSSSTDFSSATTIKKAYLEIALLRIIDPYRLMQAETRTLFSFIRKWSEYYAIHTTSDKQLDNKHIVDLDSARAPGNQYNYPDQQFKELRILDFSALVEHIQTIFKEQSDPDFFSSNTITARNNREMIQRFLKQLSFYGVQKETRHKANKNLTLIVSLRTCHYILSDKKEFDPEGEIESHRTRSHSQNQESSLSLVPMGDEGIPHEQQLKAKQLKKINPFLSEEMILEDKWEHIYSSNVINAQLKTQSFSLDDLYVEELWEEKNESHGGFQLTRFSASNNILQVGMLAACKYESDESNNYHLAIIRWLKINPKRGCAIGLMKLADKFSPLAVKAVDGIGKNSDFNQAFLLHGTLQHPDKTFLLLPSGIYDEKTVLHVWHKQQLSEVVITQKHMVTRTIMLASFKLIKIID